MATVSPSRSTFAFSSHFVEWIRRFRDSCLRRARIRFLKKQRVALHACPLCGEDLQRQAELLIERGFYRAAVTTARLRLELATTEYYRVVEHRLDEEHRIKLRRVAVRQVALALVKGNFIEIETQRRIRQVYSNLSQVVHGKACSATFAKSIIAQTAAVLAELKEVQYA